MQLLEQLYVINSPSGAELEMIEFIERWIYENVSDAKTERDDVGNLLVVKGVAESYPCVVAHTDEVHAPCERRVVHDGGMIYTLNDDGVQVGCGADDKNGIWIALGLLREMEALKVAFFVEEETGCYGSNGCSLEWLADCRFVIECDRRGGSDLVVNSGGYVPLCDDYFVPSQLCERYGYVPCVGGVTDVVELKRRGLRLPVCNISCGYYCAHSPDEYTIVSELKNAYAFAKDIVSTL